MKSARPQSSETSACAEAGILSKFDGTDNSHHLCVIAALLVCSQKREHAGCSNGPDLIGELRRPGLAIPCVRIPAFDRDEREVFVGVYSPTTANRRKVNDWLNRRNQFGFVSPHLTILLMVSAPIVVALLLIAAGGL